MNAEASPCRLLLVGGFLGAGKTTTLVAAARLLRARGCSVGLVTNDQGHGLVDTWTAESAGVEVAEVAGGCFCCRFDALLEGVALLRRRGAPEVILAEPVGSCTDLQATVVNPVRRLAGTDVRVLPLTVVVEPARLRALLRDAAGEAQDDLPAYLAERQLAEADVILLNKTDRLTADETARLMARLRALFPGSAIMPIAAATGVGVDGWLRCVWSAAAGGRPLDIDYDRYAAAEAALAWLNASGGIAAAGPLSARALAHTLLTGLSGEIGGAGGRIAHVKCSFRAEAPEARDFRAHLTADGAVIGPGEDDLTARRLQWRLNARVKMPPDALRWAVARSMDHLAQAHGAAIAWEEAEHFSPPRPIPTHRMEA